MNYIKITLVQTWGRSFKEILVHSLYKQLMKYAGCFVVAFTIFEQSIMHTDHIRTKYYSH